MAEGDNYREVKTVQIILDDFTNLSLGFENCTVYDFAQYSDITYYDDWVIDYYNFYQPTESYRGDTIDQ